MNVTQHNFRVQPPEGWEPADPRIAFFNGHAPTWDAKGPNPTATLARLAPLRERLGLRAGLDILEIGCGTGQITGWLAECVQPGRVVAADFAPAMLEQARARKLTAEFRLLDICCAQPVTEQFDLVLCFNAFPHFRDKPQALRQLAAHLKPAAELLVVHLSGSAQLNAFHHSVGGPVGHDFLPATEQWPDLLATAGLQVAELTDQADLFLLKARRHGQGAKEE